MSIGVGKRRIDLLALHADLPATVRALLEFVLCLCEALAPCWQQLLRGPRAPVGCTTLKGKERRKQTVKTTTEGALTLATWAW